MPPRLSKPVNVPEDHVPLNEMLWRFHMAAHAPSTRKIAETIASQDDDTRAGTANHETVRRTLRAAYLPEWQTVEVIFLALCQIADVDPDDEDDSDSYSNRWDSRTHRHALRQCWQRARFGMSPELPRTRAERDRQQAEREGASLAQTDPWSTDDPPF